MDEGKNLDKLTFYMSLPLKYPCRIFPKPLEKSRKRVDLVSVDF